MRGVCMRRRTVERTTIEQIEERLQQLPPYKLPAVLSFISYLSATESKPGAFERLLAAESALAKDWNRPEEDAAWANL